MTEQRIYIECVSKTRSPERMYRTARRGGLPRISFSRKLIAGTFITGSTSVRSRSRAVGAGRRCRRCRSTLSGEERQGQLLATPRAVLMM